MPDRQLVQRLLLLLVAFTLLASPAAAQDPSTPATCMPSNFDLVFILDSSGSVGEAGWDLSTTFAAEMVAELKIGKNNIQ